MNKRIYVAWILIALRLGAQVPPKPPVTIPHSPIPHPPIPRVPPRGPDWPRLPDFGPTAGCSGRQGRLELRSGGFRVLNNVCVLNYRSLVEFYVLKTPDGPISGIRLDLTDGSQADIPLSAIKAIHFTGLSRVPLDMGDYGIYADVHVDFYQTGPGVDGQTSGYLSRTARAVISDPELKLNSEDPFVLTGTDPDIGGAQIRVRFSQVKSLTLLLRLPG